MEKSKNVGICINQSCPNGFHICFFKTMLQNNVDPRLQTRVAQRTTKYFPISPIYFLPVLKRVQIYIGIQVPILVIAYTIW